MLDVYNLAMAICLNHQKMFNKYFSNFHKSKIVWMLFIFCEATRNLILC